MTAMTTYVKPFHSPLVGHKKSFHDYELEHSFNKRLSCLVGVTVVSFIIGVAALSISVLLLLQSMGPCGADKEALAGLQQRIEYLERQVPSLYPTATFGSPAHSVPAVPESPRNEPPVTEDDPASPSRGSEHGDEHTGEHDPSHEHVDEHKPSVEAVSEHSIPADHVIVLEPSGGHEGEEDPQPPVVEEGPEDSAVPPDSDLPAEYDDDEDHGEGSGDDECPQLPRPVCPVGYTICQTAQRCPQPVCCK
ncbi:uncharacterized protein [Penaeus vannamei]|uniref:uncharacterized protein n=1 Tax=Penaeus vannamei TaxID=6689 RepID=UPI00083F8F86|nr:uncharacterized protein LOC113807896 [Penaeus vannamei]PYZ99301.1 hypothetical protein A6K26_009980 [Gammaproteobacteria bacterium 2W06]